MKLESTIYDWRGRVLSHLRVMLAGRLIYPTLKGWEYPELTTAWDNAEDAAAFDREDAAT